MPSTYRCDPTGVTGASGRFDDRKGRSHLIGLDKSRPAVRTTRTTVVVAVSLLLAAACGDGESRSTTSTAPAAVPTEEATMRLTSTAFAEGATIPAEHTCDGEDVSPPLQIDGIPETTETLVLIVDDPDAPAGTWDHWVAFDIAPAPEIPRDVGALGIAGVNSFGTTGYGGPCPPSGSHRYVHQVYALDTALGLPEGATRAEVLEAMEGHVLAEATLTGLYR